MTIKYTINRSHINTEQESYHGRVQIGRSLDLEDVADRMMRVSFLYARGTVQLRSRV